MLIILGLIYKMLITCIILSYNFHGNICESILNLMDALHTYNANTTSTSLYLM
jgi:hypothetical protein